MSDQISIQTKKEAGRIAYQETIKRVAEVRQKREEGRSVSGQKSPDNFFQESSHNKIGW